MIGDGWCRISRDPKHVFFFNNLFGFDVQNSFPANLWSWLWIFGIFLEPSPIMEHISMFYPGSSYKNHLYPLVTCNPSSQSFWLTNIIKWTSHCEMFHPNHPQRSCNRFQHHTTMDHHDISERLIRKLSIGLVGSIDKLALQSDSFGGT